MNKTNIEIINLVPQFLLFLDESKVVDTIDEKWEVWEEKYNFAAVPPTDEGIIRAKKEFSKVYDDYLLFEKQIRNFIPDETLLKDCLMNICEELNFHQDFDLKIIYFVGFFESNPFVTTDREGKLTLCLPIENFQMDDYFKIIQMYHELTHICHYQILQKDLFYQRSLAFLMIQEGLALHMSKKMIPGLEDSNYLSYQQNWYEEAKENHDAIFNGIREYISNDDSEILYRYTMGTGSTGLEREAYYVGWIIVGKALNDGYSYFDLMTLNEVETNELAKKYI